MTDVDMFNQLNVLVGKKLVGVEVLGVNNIKLRFDDGVVSDFNVELVDCNYGLYGIEITNMKE